MEKEKMTTKPKQKIEFEKKWNYLVKDGVYYEWENRDGKAVLVLADKKKIDEKEVKVKEIAKKIKEGLNPEAVITEALMQIGDKDIEKLYKLVNSTKRKYKPKTREGHCVDMKVGRFIIPIVN